MDGAIDGRIEGPHFESIFTEPFKELVSCNIILSTIFQTRDMLRRMCNVVYLIAKT